MTHEFDAKKYEKASTPQKEWGSKLISERDLRGIERVLDLGTGDGTLHHRWLADIYARIVKDYNENTFHRGSRI